MALRWGDKCYQTESTADRNRQGNFVIPPEMGCPNVEQYMAVAETLRALKPNVDTIILTSESAEVIDSIFRYFELVNNVTTSIESNQQQQQQQQQQHNARRLYSNWTFILNIKDLHIGVGILDKFLAHHQSQFNSSSDYYYNGMVGMLSSFYLQMLAKYYTLLEFSKWSDSIWLFAYELQCLPKMLQASSLPYVSYTGERQCIELRPQNLKQHEDFPVFVNVIYDEHLLQDGLRQIVEPNRTGPVHIRDFTRSLRLTHRWDLRCERWKTNERSYKYAEADSN
ncbi:hypothetical protein RFI_24668 [Reticulomyxa filosa]|uniref:Uncharacterized protein n=1 Tax=Reticulomyxa filosa TaxID=46433 RepID=X6MGZ8_RETFI|nr:hypothetical protein RFI_24668 [Reticulomyxa filosa]|eukprot:ETO12707.1 hypothetical protein RFI_24668 [Reticulomyxa filosa]